ncbi:MAG: IS66 family transposase [Ktedonobacteraceae bacterium]
MTEDDFKKLLAQKEQRIQEVEGRLMAALLRIEELERRQAKDSHNSSLPPSRDHGTRKPLGQRPKSQKPSGGQEGHAGHALQAVEKPDEVIVHRPERCQHCQQELGGQAGQVVERRQVNDLPKVRLWVQEHQVETVDCPHCQQQTRGRFPVGVHAPVQYGSGVRGLAVYLSHYQLVPLQRTGELLADLLDAPVSQGAIREWVQEASRTLAPTLERIRELLLRAKQMHVDETSIHMNRRTLWVHDHGTKDLTLYCWHAKRGAQGIEEIGLIPQYEGRMMHDRWTSYDRYACTHSVCGAHLIRDAIFVAEQEKQPWAQAMVEHLRDMVQHTTRWREQGASQLPSDVRQGLLARYFEILASGYAAHGPPAPSPKKAGRKKQNPSLNLLDTFLHRAEQVLGFLDDLSVPFTNNLAERDLRMIKVQQKISGTFRSPEGASAFCTIRSYLSTMRKQARPLLEALRAVFAGSPFPIAWQPGT